MKTALDLPDDLVTEVKILAARNRRKLKDTVADLLRLGLDAASGHEPEPTAPVEQDPLTSLPVVACNHAARASDRLTPERVAEILLNQEAGWTHEAGR